MMDWPILIGISVGLALTHLAVGLVTTGVVWRRAWRRGWNERGRLERWR